MKNGDNHTLHSIGRTEHGASGTRSGKAYTQGQRRIGRALVQKVPDAQSYSVWSPMGLPRSHTCDQKKTLSPRKVQMGIIPSSLALGPLPASGGQNQIVGLQEAPFQSTQLPMHTRLQVKLSGQLMVHTGGLGCAPREQVICPKSPCR